MKKEKILYQTESITRYGCSYAKVIELEGKRFKLTHDTANGHSHTHILVQTPDLSWTGIATEFDLNGKTSINYVDYDYEKKEQMANIYKLSVEYIKKVCF